MGTPNILVIHPRRTMRLLAVGALGRLGYPITNASSAGAAAGLYGARRFDVIVYCREAHSVSDAEALVRLRGSSPAARVVAIAAAQGDADIVLGTPFDLGEMVGAVGALLARDARPRVA